MNKKYMYRYDYYKGLYGGSPRMQLLKYEILRETPCGYWIDLGDLIPAGTKREKWVSKNSGGFAQETKEAALKRFIRRKQNYLLILKSKIYEVEKVIKAAKREEENQ